MKAVDNLAGSQAGDTEDAKSTEELLQAAQIEREDDSTIQSSLTVRMWVISVVFSLIGCGLNTLFTLRNPSISIDKPTALLLAFPAGRLWDACVPNYTITIWGTDFSLNPHPFNTKEHVLIYVMVNITFFTRMTADLIVEQKHFFGLDSGWAYEVLMILSLFLIGFAFAGLTRRVLVEPRQLIWPGLLSSTALISTLHDRVTSASERGKSYGKLSAFSFFCIMFTASFIWYWLPDFLFPALSYFNFPCWTRPHSPVVNQVFGVSSGMGLLPLTFDWSQVAYIGSPLVVPSWAIVNVAVALVVWIYGVSTALYYKNVWNTAYLPFQSTSIFDNTGATYNVSRILSGNSNFTLDVSKYENYSPVFMPITYAMSTFGLAIATLASLIVWVILEHWDSVSLPFKGLRNLHQIFSRSGRTDGVIRSTSDVPVLWYIISLSLGLFLAVFSVEYWHIQLRWYGVLCAFAVGAVFYFPVTLIYANANIKVGVESFCRIIGGLLWEGKVLANVWFVGLGYTTILDGLSFSQDMKLCLYYGISPNEVFVAQSVGIIIGTLGQVAVVNWALGHIKGICTTEAINGFSCPYSRTNFNTSVIWGAIGPRRFFSPESGYRHLFYLLIIGAILPVFVYLLKRRYPGSFWKNVSVPLLLGGLNYMPPASGMNYGSWAVVGLIFGYFVRKRYNGWWRRYNFILSSSLETSVSLAGVVIFFAVYYPGVSDRVAWWGTDVYKNTCDWMGCPYLSLQPGEKIP